jgi:hypothetical protein
MSENILIKTSEVIKKNPECGNNEESEIIPGAECKRDVVTELQGFDIFFAKNIKSTPGNCRSQKVRDYITKNLFSFIHKSG